jgi:hypothetical protein
LICFGATLNSHIDRGIMFWRLKVIMVITTNFAKWRRFD